MSWRPPDPRLTGHDPRLDRYRERAGRLHGPDGTHIADLYLETEIYWEQTGGFLWWRRWSTPKEILHGYLTFADGTSTDFLVLPEGLKEELQHWAQNRFPLQGELLVLTWLNDEESRELRDSCFPPEPS